MKGEILGRPKLVWVTLGIVLACITVSFVWGWYGDKSKSLGGYGWSDQDTYVQESNSFAHFKLPHSLHFAIGYPLMGAVGHIVSQTDPFVAVSFGIILASVALCFFAACRLFGPIWAGIFCLLLFFWYPPARVFAFASDLFVVPWNNQVLFFAFAYYFWLFATQLRRMPSWKLSVATGLVSGVAFMTREESILFIVPVLAAFLYATKADWRRWVACYGLVILCYAPQLLVRAAVVGSVTSSGRTVSYDDIAHAYFSISHLHTNIWSTIIDSRHVPGVPYPGPNVHRPALLQAAPWLWLSPIGIGLVFFARRYAAGLKIFFGASIVLMLFYLSGNNMSAGKLPFHCLRYIAPAFIMLNLAVIIVAREVVRLIVRQVRPPRTPATPA